MRLIKETTHIDFLGPQRRKIALSFSLLFVIVSFASLATRGLDFGIDFTGGVLLEVGYSQAADLEMIRNNLADAGFSDAQVQQFGEDTDVLVRLPPQGAAEPGEIRTQLQAVLEAGGETVDLRRVEFVSPPRGPAPRRAGARPRPR